MPITANIRTLTPVSAGLRSAAGINGEMGGAKLVQGPKGDPGDSAYDQAVQGGYTGTKEEFEEMLAALPQQAAQAAQSAAAAAQSEENAAQSKEGAAQSAQDAAQSAALAQSAVGKGPYIGENGNWYVWDTQTGAFKDTGVPATALRDQNSGATVKMWFGTLEEYNALHEIREDTYYNILEGEV